MAIGSGCDRSSVELVLEAGGEHRPLDLLTCRGREHEPAVGGLHRPRRAQHAQHAVVGLARAAGDRRTDPACRSRRRRRASPHRPRIRGRSRCAGRAPPSADCAAKVAVTLSATYDGTSAGSSPSESAKPTRACISESKAGSVAIGPGLAVARHAHPHESRPAPWHRLVVEPERLRHARPPVGDQHVGGVEQRMQAPSVRPRW